MGALRAAERRLDRASRRARAARTPAGEAPDDPLTELLATFPYKEAPLFVQQTTRTTAQNDHRLFASVLREQFCLKSRRQRLAAVRRVFELGDGYLRERGSTHQEGTRMPRLILTLLAAVCLAAGCGTTGSGDPADTAATPTPKVGTDEGSIDAVEEQLQALARRKEAAKKAGDTKTMEQLEQAMQNIERVQDEAIEDEFAATSPFDKAVDILPMKKPPLYVEQVILDDTHTLVVRSKSRRFFCGRTEEQRLAAVAYYYGLAESAMTANGIDDFVLIVDGLRETGDVMPLARGADGKVSLTARGRGRGPC